MSAFAGLYWPGKTVSQRVREPGFALDAGHAFSLWVVEVLDRPGLADTLRAAGFGALLSYKTVGMSDERVDWVPPGRLVEVAAGMRRRVLHGDPWAAPFTAAYPRLDPDDDPRVRLAEDLADVEAAAIWAVDQGANVVTMGYTAS